MRTPRPLLSTTALAAAVFALPALLRKRGTDRRDDDAFYDGLSTPTWAPPPWAFPVAWAINTAALAWAAQRLYRDRALPRRGELLGLLAVHTALYATFGRVYFGERSPVLAAGWTAADLAVCHLAFYRALAVDPPAAAAFVPVNLWLTLALPLSLHQAAANRDPLFGTAGVEVGEIVAGALGVTPIPARPAARP